MHSRPPVSLTPLARILQVKPNVSTAVHQSEHSLAARLFLRSAQALASISYYLVTHPVLDK